jgi:hypothetical protein
LLTVRRLMTWLTVASAVAVEIGPPKRWRSPQFGISSC